MTYSSDWFTSSKAGNKINSKDIYTALYSEIQEKIDQNLSVNQIIGWIRQKTREIFVTNWGLEPTTGALNVSCGRWNEFIATSFLCEIAIDTYQRDKKCVVVFSLENSKIVLDQMSGQNDGISASFLKLFAPTEFLPTKPLALIQDVRQKIFLPSPDYIIAILDKDNPLIDPVQSLMQVQARDPSSLELYKLLRGKLKAHELKAVVSLKTSNRPDRRYQPSFEAAMIKAINHVAKQEWKYYMVVSELSLADKVLFENAISPHSIILGEDKKLVDKLYFYQRKSDLQKLVTTVLG